MFFDFDTIFWKIIQVQVQVAKQYEIGVVGLVIFSNPRQNPLHKRVKFLSPVSHVVPEKEVSIDGHELIGFGSGMADNPETDTKRLPDEV